MNPPPAAEREFDDWYETEHIPDRLAIPGFRQATRYRALDGEPVHLAVYDLDDLAALERADYRRLKEQPSDRTAWMLANVTGFTRYTCEATFASPDSAAPHTYLSVVAFEVPEADAAAFDEWYKDEHVPALLRAPDWLRVRRFRVLGQMGYAGRPSPPMAGARRAPR